MSAPDIEVGTRVRVTTERLAGFSGKQGEVIDLPTPNDSLFIVLLDFDHTRLALGRDELEVVS